MKRLAVGLFSVAAMLSTAAHAEGEFAKAGTILVRLRAVVVAPDDGGHNTGILPSVPTGTVNVGNAYVPEVDITYFVTPNIAIETICCAARHSIKGDGAVAALGKLGKTWVTPFTFNLQYHANLGSVVPYIGVGPTWTVFYGEKETAALTGALGPNVKLNVKNKVGVDLQAGLDIPMGERWVINADFKYYFLKPKATLTGGAVPTQTIGVRLNPIIAGVGIGYRF